MKYFVDVGGAEIEVTLEGNEVHLNDTTVDARIVDVEGTPERVLLLGDEVHRVIVRRESGRGRYTIWVGGFRFDVEALDERTRAIRALAASSATPSGPAPLVAPMPGMVVRVQVGEGDSVQSGQGLVVMEAMKMENELRATASGIVRRVHVTPGTAVEKGALLLEME
jgi:biotin carboxyl carrier protein